ncbi:polyamine oxidase 3 [Aplysia californica]|uniref:Amine oxidase n=1 Tax=Aplysia californica TaxID=6500 RepID=A0ABM0JAN6_APLCA|nr:polyamine oxidase 3 [Aplysia californica]XP_005089305.1 polyamine oxidase 3 [Aplysia californica]
MRRKIFVLAVLLVAEFCAADRGRKKEKTSEKSSVKTDSEKEDDGIKKAYPLLHKEVVVVGAGIAGLAAARRISKDRSNFTVTVYEAQKNRYGGRVWTDKLTNMKAKGVEVDLGSSAFNVISKNNPLLELAEDFELKTSSIEGLQFIIPWEGKVYSGSDIQDITKEAGQILNQALNESKSWKFEPSVREAVDKVLHDDFSSESTGSHLVKCLPSYVIKDYSTRHYRPELLDMGYEKVLLDGTGELLDRLVSGSSEEPPLHLQLNKAVRQIKFDNSKGKVIIRFRDGSQRQTDVVVVAVPLSIIASQDIMFEPDLPKNYQVAVSEMGVLTSNKLILEFESAFWPSDFGVFLRAVQEDQDRGYMQSWINIHRLVGLPVLTTFVMGDSAIGFEKMTDDDIKQSALDVLIEMFGKDTVSKGGDVVRLQRSQWVTEEFSKGSHTYSKVGTTPELWETLSEPLCPGVYFVGEHTSLGEHGTLHGAYNSGIRAGDQILSRYCEKKMEEEERRREEARRKEAERKKKENGGGANASEERATKEVSLEDDDDVVTEEESDERKDEL